MKSTIVKYLPIIISFSVPIKWMSCKNYQKMSILEERYLLKTFRNVQKLSDIIDTIYDYNHNNYYSDKMQYFFYNIFHQYFSKQLYTYHVFHVKFVNPE